MPSSAQHIHTKLVDEPFFIDCEALYDSRTGQQIGTIQEIEWVRLEKSEDTDPVTWSEAIAAARFSSIAKGTSSKGLTDAQVKGLTTADRDAVPAPGDGYMFVTLCTIVFTAAFGSGTAKRVFRRPDRIPASLVTAPAS